MKKELKELRLHRETLRGLDRSSYRTIAGGATASCGQSGMTEALKCCCTESAGGTVRTTAG